MEELDRELLRVGSHGQQRVVAGSGAERAEARVDAEHADDGALAQPGRRVWSSTRNRSRYVRGLRVVSGTQSSVCAPAPSETMRVPTVCWAASVASCSAAAPCPVTSVSSVTRARRLSTN